MNENASVNWGHEIGHVFKIIGKVLFKIFSYVMNILLTLLLIGLITGIIVCSVFAIYIKNYLDLEIDPSTIVQINSDSTTRIYYVDYETEEDRVARNGKLVEVENQRLYGTENAIAVSYNQLPKNLVNAFISIEDKRFRSHNGVDWITTGNAIYKFIFGGDGGGSTITQQLIKNVTGEDQVTIQRKVEEIFRALNLEKVKSKNEILEAYLNIVYFGNNCYGVQAASEFYFDKDVSDLSLVECAALASIVKNPSQYDPKRHEDDFTVTVNGEEIVRHGNSWRRWVVLDQMKENGCITEAECIEAQSQTLNIRKDDEDSSTLSEGMTLYSWYTESMLTQVHYDLMQKYNCDSRTAWNMIYYNGYKIVTPMDPFVQDTLEEIYENDSQYFPSTGSGLQPQSACVVCDPYTGDVLGIVGGRGTKTMNRVTDRASVSTRPPGSSIKPLSVYAPGIDSGVITYGSVIDDTPVFFNRSGQGYTDADGHQVYSYSPYPQNLPNIYMGLTTIHSAVTRSVNTVAMKTLQKLGIDYSYDFMKNKLHFDSLIDSVTLSNGETITDRGLAALALGQPNYGVTLLEMTAAYCIFQNNGIYNNPHLYLYVLDAEGNVVLDGCKDPEIVISDDTASIMTIMMQDVMNHGTGMASTLRYSVDVAGKTGTTSSDFDRYFMGYTPYYVGGVWTGYDIPQSLSAFGANPSLTVWDLIMTKLHQKYIDEAQSGGEQLKEFEVSPGVITCSYCADSGKLCSQACYLDPRGSREEVGYFTRETMPTEYCDTHVIVQRDNSTGLIASPQCNEADCSPVALIRVEDRSFPAEIYVQDAQYVYREMPSSVKPSGWWGVPFFVNMLKDGEFCGSSYVDTPFNAYCYEHCDYRPWGGDPPSKASGADEPDEDDPLTGEDGELQDIIDGDGDSQVQPDEDSVTDGDITDPGESEETTLNEDADSTDSEE